MSTQAMRPSLASIEQSPIQRALDNYNEMEHLLADAEAKAHTLSIQNASMVAEVNMLREELAAADGDRIRLQAISSTLLGRLLAINDTIAGAVRASIKDGIEATDAAQTAQQQAEAETLEQDAQEAQEIIQRIPLSQEPPVRITAGAVLQPFERAVPEPVDWSKLPRG